MDARRSEYDVSNRIDTTDPGSVEGEVRRICVDLYPRARTALLSRAFGDCARMYQGLHPAYRACDTAYHNLQHTLDVTLAMARLMDGYQRSERRAEPIGDRVFVFGIVTALFHDIGYLRRRNDTRHHNGAEYTLRHVSRGGRFLNRYLIELGMPDLAAVGAELIHFTGYEVPVNAIRVSDPMFRRIGNMLGTADIIGQMSDRCYLEKCRDRLYPEFVAGGLAWRGGAAPGPAAQFSSAEDLLNKTPAFYVTAERRLSELLGSAFDYARTHFGGRNLYLDAVLKNVRHARRVAALGEARSLLRRNPPPREENAVRLAA
ncbi:MAG TPA: hypothetical protein VFU53_05125 [Burkholderiales bacterium]|nr:hypothetical protein [Burkholderiales bacterium]